MDNRPVKNLSTSQMPFRPQMRPRCLGLLKAVVRAEALRNTSNKTIHLVTCVDPMLYLNLSTYLDAHTMCCCVRPAQRQVPGRTGSTAHVSGSSRDPSTRHPVSRPRSRCPWTFPLFRKLDSELTPGPPDRKVPAGRLQLAAYTCAAPRSGACTRHPCCS